MLEKVCLYVFRGLATHCADQIALIRTVYPSEEFLLPEPGEEFRLTLAEGRALLRQGAEEYRNVSDGHVNVSREGCGCFGPPKVQDRRYVLDKFPEGARPFYAIEDRENPKFTNAFDFSMRGRET
ncbi:hypothetical protein J3458_009371 [Metarhizium acridum]|uniref:uncharacterized protein n=1 Tax=Metarhizium acridum TaxID=92637 RepID=UPI001C6AEB3C|nr:hypothetical protein J3458_009371 [Metarhizium acridum]